MDQLADAERSDLQSQFARMYRASLPSVYGFALLRVGGNQAVAEDLTAETFAAAVVEYRAGRAEVVTASWLHTVAVRRLVDHWRRRAVASDKIVVLAERPRRSVEPDLVERAVVAEALAVLSEEHRSVLVLHHIEGYPVAEVAEIIARTPKATESLLVRARAAFRAAYQQQEVAGHG